MKKCIILGIVFLMSVSASAQIKRNIGGVILGESTKKEIQDYLRSKNIYPQQDGLSIYGKGDISFGGVLWTAVYYEFYKETLFRITYTKVVKGHEKELRSKYKELRNNLYKKYVKRTPKDNSLEYSPKTFIKDKTTLIKLSIQDPNNKPNILYLKLTYLDTRIDKQNKQQEFDDL